MFSLFELRQYIKLYYINLIYKKRENFSSVHFPQRKNCGKPQIQLTVNKECAANTKVKEKHQNENKTGICQPANTKVKEEM